MLVTQLDLDYQFIVGWTHFFKSISDSIYSLRLGNMTRLQITKDDDVYYFRK